MDELESRVPAVDPVWKKIRELQTEKAALVLELSEKERKAEIEAKKREEAEEQTRILADFLLTMGFKKQGISFVNIRSRRCSCGGYPIYVRSIFDGEKMWIAKCDGCEARTMDARNPAEAVRFWNRGAMTDATEMCRTMLTVESTSTQGAMNMLYAVKKVAIKDLIASAEHDSYDTESAKTAEWFLGRDKKLVNDIKAKRITKVRNDGDEE